MTVASDLVIGVDGGGTKTDAWLAPLQDDGTGIVLGRGRAGPGNPRAAGFEVAQASIDAAIEAAFADAKLPRDRVTAACLCLSGAGRPAEQIRLSQWADARGVAQFTQVTGDAEPILAAASPENCGIALISGTGSLAWGRNRAGEVARNGGWGYLLGDQGSAYAIALAGLRHAVLAADDRGPATELLAAFQRQLDAATPADLIDRIYSAEMTRERLASLAVVVFDTAPHDETAEFLIESAARQLYFLVDALARRLNLPTGDYPLAISGSVLLNQEPLRALLASMLSEAESTPREMIVVEQPARGAVALARIAATTR